MLQDIVIVLVMTVPMFMFSVYPGIRAGEYLEKKYALQEKQKRTAVISVTFLFSLTLSLFLHYF
ncbi:MAG: hypothetical protein A2525_06865 [Sulfurimonas sp. RIFOXYD12_FULL_36_11]|jgi:hypothetical protein|nr:hypothetical protein [Sulfurimonas sp.]OHE03855.1 MAG: hypothetical protein A2345_03065 [Sulfurimonas sp. RIFOXYB12_FULL_35_9]OHE12193.1 MAG: hypothetical protein A3J96_05555 [Sulfurimonas sp. RIFOXYC2_FULL_36_7]OHE15278.1 MAG: hypothetical protein A2540_10495 [Sulfurimonas sp. RIFOXYD2_FULL_37_8]OHE15720.1 MAG: hypothetical protein A2329_01625 [Sulfurimonas sp. RIFOXYB2_FULL_37_5]OHE20349.1 MAG: hypothetical protein A2525_06865 [Sulfurimonas sp. RIFOXYD12_FULL_36_11]